MSRLFFIFLLFVSCSDEKLILNKTAPEIFAKNTEGARINLDKKGIELVQFWENGCAACLKVMASLDKYALKHGIKIYAINSIDDLKIIKKHKQNSDYQGIIFLQDQQDISWSRYEIFAVPALFILKDGVYIDKVLGDRGFEYIKNKLEKII